MDLITEAGKVCVVGREFICRSPELAAHEKTAQGVDLGDINF